MAYLWWYRSKCNYIHCYYYIGYTGGQNNYRLLAKIEGKVGLTGQKEIIF